MNHQIDCSRDLGSRLGNEGGRLWSMRNGYLFPTDEGLQEISTKRQQASDVELEELRGEVKISGLKLPETRSARG